MIKTDREICEAATQGKWTAKNYVVTIGGKLRIKVYGKEGVKQDDAQYIAHFNPSKVAEMLDEISRLKAERDALQGELCHTLAYKDGTVYDKSSALEIAKQRGYKCFDNWQPKEKEYRNE